MGLSLAYQSLTTVVVCLGVAAALQLVLVIVAWRLGVNLPTLLLSCGLLAIMLGAFATEIVALIGFRQGWNAVPLPLALGIQLGLSLAAIALSVAAVVIHRRRQAASR
jgi:hypothetical protein